VSSDLYHWDEDISQQVLNAKFAANELGIPFDTIHVDQPEKSLEASDKLMYRGRAAEKLVNQIPHTHWESFDHCPYEDLRDPGRIHVDPLGYLHTCQGIVIGNLFKDDLATVWERFDPDDHPVIAPLSRGGPAELVRTYKLPHLDAYADACHLCYSARISLRSEFPDLLAPNQIYGLIV
jgi:hypothetical protein